MRLSKSDLDKMCLFDDAFFAECFRDHPECTEELLRIILGIPDIKVIRHSVQNSFANGANRGVRLDVYAVNEKDNTIYDIEVQKTDTGNLPQRARYYSSVIDSNDTIKPKENYDRIPRSYVIFICKDDIMKRNKAIYHYRRKDDDNIELNDGSNIIFVNGAYDGDDAIGNLMNDFSQTDKDNVRNEVLAKRIAETKEGDSGDMIVTHFDRILMEAEAEARKTGLKQGLEQGRELGLEQGREQGREQGKTESSIDTAKRMLAKGKLSVEEIAEYSSLPIETVKELAKGA